MINWQKLLIWGLMIIFSLLFWGVLIIGVFKGCAKAEVINYTNGQIVNAIYKTEGGNKTNYPYGILAKYKYTTPRQACINTIIHARKDFKGGDFIEFLGSRYCPIGAKNDPKGLNKNWVKNVKYYLDK